MNEFTWALQSGYAHSARGAHILEENMIGGIFLEKDQEISVANTMEGMFPLPLTEENLDVLTQDEIVMETTNDLIRKIYPEINKVPNVNTTIIPIIPGITLYSYIRFFNGYASTPVDFYVNGKLIASSVKYREFTEYFKAFPGYYRITVYEAGKKRTPLITKFINLIGYRVYTVALSGEKDLFNLELINDNTKPLPRRTAYLRFVQLSPNAPTMDAYLDDSLVLSELNYLDVSRYLSARPGVRNLKFRDSLSGGVLAEEPELKLEGGKAYSVYVVGNVNDRTGLQILLVEEGISFLTF